MSAIPREKRFKPEFRIAVACAALLAAVTSMLFLYYNFHAGRLNPFEKIELQNMLMAKTDAAGDIYAIDSGMSRIAVIDKYGTARYEINGGTGGAFYNANDIAAEGERSIFVHEVEWDSSGMSVSAERILEFDKESGSPSGELYLLDRRATDASPELSALIAIQGLRFEDGKLWFVRKSPDFFALYSLVPGEEAVAERLVSYRDALPALSYFSIDVPTGRIFFVDKAGVIRVSVPDETNGTKVVFNPVSGVSAREFSLPYRLSFDGDRLYFSDIGKRAVMRLDGENSAEAVFGGWEGPGLPALYYFAHSRGDLLTLAGENSIVGVSPSGEEIFRASTFPAGRRIVLLRMCLWGCALILLSSLLLVFAAVLRLVLNGRFSVSLAIIMGVAIAFAVIVPPLLNWVSGTERNEIINRLSYIMEISPQILDTEALAEINTPQDYDGQAYRRFKRSLDDLVERESEWNRLIYCDVFKFKDDIRYSVCFLDGTIGAFFNPVAFEGSDAQMMAESGEWIKNMDYQDVSGSYMSVCGPIYDAGGGMVGGIEIGVDTRALSYHIFTLSRNMTVRILLILALLLFVASEILESAPFAKTSEQGGGPEIPIGRLRPIIFASYLAFNLSVGFLPNYALKIGGSFMGLSPEVSAAMPVAASSVMLAISPLLTPSMIARMGYRLSFSIGAILCVAGYAACAFAASLSPLVAGMVALGLGSGVLYTVTFTCVASRRSAGDKTLGFSSFAAASFSGVNCGIMAGGVIATRFGQKAVFSCGAFLMAFIMAAFLFLTRKYAHALHRAGEGVTNQARAPMAFPKGIVAFLCLSFFPFTMYSGFMYYLVPVFGSQSGFSDAELSMVFVFFGVGLTFLGPRIAAAALGKEPRISYFLWLALIIELAGMICFAILPSIAAMLATVLFLGVAAGIGNTYFPLYLTEMPEAKRLRDGIDIALFNFTDNLGFAVGPMIFSAIFQSGASCWYYILAASILLSSLLYCATKRDAGPDPIRAR